MLIRSTFAKSKQLNINWNIEFATPQNLKVCLRVFELSFILPSFIAINCVNASLSYLFGSIFVYIDLIRGVKNENFNCKSPNSI